jgi:hypothetical protein
LTSAQLTTVIASHGGSANKLFSASDIKVAIGPTAANSDADWFSVGTTSYGTSSETAGTLPGWDASATSS